MWRIDWAQEGKRELKSMKSKLIYNGPTKLIRVDADLHQSLKIHAARNGTTIKNLIETYLDELLSVRRKPLK